MILRQFLHSDPIAASYLLGCAGHAAAAVVDPVGDMLTDVPPAPPGAAKLRAANAGAMAAAE
jgi:hypothetical protein